MSAHRRHVMKSKGPLLGPECGCYHDAYGDPWVIVVKGHRERHGPPVRW